VTWRVGLVGVGDFVQRAYLPALQETEGMEVTLLCGRSRDRTEAVRRAWSLDARVEVDREGLVRALDDDVVDAVIVVVPDRLHAEMVRAVLGAGRHVLCEKPITIDAASARELRDLAARTPSIAMMAFTYRYTLAMRKARELIEDGVIGNIAALSYEVHYGEELSELTWRGDGEMNPGGIWCDGGSHMIDTIGVLAGPLTTTHVVAATVTRSSGARPTNPDVAAVVGSVERGTPWFTMSHRASDLEKVGVVAVSGTLSRLDAMKADQVQIIGSAGSLNLSLGRGDVEWLDVWRPDGDRQRLLAVEENSGATAPTAVVRMVAAWRDSMMRGVLGEWDAGFDVGCAVQEVLSGIDVTLR
jgi:predicted dehydrogenase